MHTSYVTKCSVICHFSYSYGSNYKEERLRESPKGTSVPQKQLNRRKALHAERARQDQACCPEQSRTRGCTTQDSCLGQEQSGQWSRRWGTGPLTAVTYEKVGETSCRAYRWQTGPPAAVTYVYAQINKNGASSGSPHNALHSLV